MLQHRFLTTILSRSAIPFRTNMQAGALASAVRCSGGLYAADSSRRPGQGTLIARLFIQAGADQQGKMLQMHGATRTRSYGDENVMTLRTWQD